MKSNSKKKRLHFTWPASGLNSSLLNSIESVVGNAANHNHNPVYAVAFDREYSDIDPSLLNQIKEIGNHYDTEIKLFDLDCRLSLKEELNETAESEVLDSLLYPSIDGLSYGCNKNLNLLLSAGQYLISTDDDIICNPARVGAGISKDLFWSDEYYPGDLRCCKDRQEILKAVTEIELDIVGSYISFFSISDGIKEEGKIITICPGTYGDSCMASQNSLLNLKDDSRSYLLKNYEELRYSREMVRIPAYNALSRSPQFIMAQAGIDNTIPIPPFLPYGRNSDGLIRFLIMLLYPDALTLFPAFGLLHSPSTPRRADKESLTNYKPHLSSLVMAAAMYSRPGKDITDIEERFRILGSGIEEIGSLPVSDFTEAVHSALSVGLQNYAAQLEESLERYNREPELWAEDVLAHLESVFALLREPERMFGSVGCGLSVERAQFHFRNYGRLLSVWPAIHRRAASLNLMEMD